MVDQRVTRSGDVERDARPADEHTVSGPAARFGETWAVEAAAGVLRGRWKLSILWCLGAGPRRFNALAAALPSVTPKVLTERLRELERDGVVTRRSERSGPKHVEYELSPAGRSLLPALEALDAWGRAWAEHCGWAKHG